MNRITNTDVLILGGGAAGVAAAVAASREGCTVALIERNAFLGGKATAAEVGTVCGLYEFNSSATSTYIVKGFAKTFAESLRIASHTNPLSNAEGLHYLPYDVEVFKHYCHDMLEKNKVELLLNASLEKLQVENNSIISADIRQGDDIISFSCKSIIDCSGDSIISRAANTPLIESENYQAAAQVFSIQNVEEENEARLGFILMKALRSAIDEKILPDHFDRVYLVPGSLKNNSVSMKIGIPVPVTYEPGNLLEINESGKKIVETLAAFLFQKVPAFKNASIASVAPEAGIRVGIRTVGKHILTEDEVLECRKFDDAIANGSWPIEEWEQHKRVKMRYFNRDDFYQVPAGCLHSKAIGNLFMAGRNISATDGAIASARVMGICLQTGYAAGCLAAGNALGTPEEETIKNIQNQQL